MKKYFLLMAVFISASCSVFGITWEDMNERWGFKKRFEKFEAFEQELEKYGLTDLDKECVANKVESCFILKKLMEREVKYLLEIDKTLREIENEEKNPPQFDFENMQKFIDLFPLVKTIFPELNNAKETILKERQQRLLKAKEREFKKLKKLECKSTADVEGLKQYMECRIKTGRSKYHRLQEKYPNKLIKIEDSWITEKIFGSRYYHIRSEAYWLSHVQFLKQSCTRYGNIDSCVELQKMRKK